MHTYNTWNKNKTWPASISHTWNVTINCKQEAVVALCNNIFVNSVVTYVKWNLANIDIQNYSTYIYLFTECPKPEIRILSSSKVNVRSSHAEILLYVFFSPSINSDDCNLKWHICQVNASTVSLLFSNKLYTISLMTYCVIYVITTYSIF